MRRILIVSALLGIGKVLAACSPSWQGTAPFCAGSCPPGTHKTKTSNCGDGKCCWSGSKVYCECNDNPGCAAVWLGTAPFCSPGGCPSGWHEAGRSDWGDGGYCVTGKKKLCDCDGGGGAPCQPKPADVSCAGAFLICNNGCSKYVCGGCLGFG